MNISITMMTIHKVKAMTMDNHKAMIMGRSAMIMGRSAMIMDK